MTNSVQTWVSNRSPALAVMEGMFEGFATGNDNVVDQLCAPNMIEHQFGLAGTGSEAIEHVKEAMRQVHATTPDIKFIIEDAVERGNTIWVRATARGTNTGAFFGPPSRRPVEITVIDVARIVNGRIAEHWGVPDRFALLAQTGVLDRLSRGA